MSIFKRAAKAVMREVLKPESFVKGEAFEEYVRKYLFPKRSYELLEKTHSQSTIDNDYVKSDKNPDFKFKDLNTGKVFFVECKYRSDSSRDGITWCKDYQLKRYKSVHKKTPVLLALGYDNEPSDPDQIFIISLDVAKYSRLYWSVLNQNKHYRRKEVFSSVVSKKIKSNNYRYKKSILNGGTF